MGFLSAFDHGLGGRVFTFYHHQSAIVCLSSCFGLESKGTSKLMHLIFQSQHTVSTVLLTSVVYIGDAYLSIFL